MNRKFAVAALAVTATITLAGCHTQHPAQQATTHTPPAAAGSAQAELNAIPVRPETVVRGYSHDGWARVDGKCNTRAYLLLHTGTGTRANKSCTVQSGRWKDAYGGPDLDNPRKGVQVDHMVPLHKALESGADTWSPQLWGAFVNDLQGVDGRHPGDPRARETVVANASLNMAKGDHPPNEWLPPTHQCEYTAAYVHVQRAWNERAAREGHDLSMTAQVKSGTARILDSCSKAGAL